METIKTSKGLEITLDMETIYSQIHKAQDQLSKKDIENIATKLGFKVKLNKTKSDMISSLLGQIYQSNYLDSVKRNFERMGRRYC